MHLAFTTIVPNIRKVPIFSGHGQALPPERRAGMEALFAELAADARIFVIADSILHAKWAEEKAAAIGATGEPASRFELDLPFRTTWYEAHEASLFVLAGPALGKFYVYAALIHEVMDPQDREKDAYAFALFGSDEKDSPPRMLMDSLTRAQWEQGREVRGFTTARGIVAHRATASVIDYLRSKSTLATEHFPAQRLRLGTGAHRRLVKITEVIHVRPRGGRGKTPPQLGGRMDWAYRWEVMGHWRRISGVGKDRGGARTMPGVTWIVPHVRGPADKPVVPKIRQIDA